MVRTGSRLAIDGGAPVRRKLLPYAKPWVTAEDITAVSGVLETDWLTTGPKIDALEQAFAVKAGAGSAAAVSSGTAALHAAMHSLRIGPGDEVIVPAMTFAATANAAVMVGAKPVFADVDPETLLIDPASVESRMSSRTRLIVSVDFAGQSCDYQSLGDLADQRGLPILADACHALGAKWCGRTVGSLAAMTVFSLHAVKHVTAGEGGVVVSDDPSLIEAVRRFRNHGLSRDHRQRSEAVSWEYEMVEMGYNYRLSDLQAALCLSQLDKLDAFVARRREIAALYDRGLSALEGVDPLRTDPEAMHAYHLYVVRLDLEKIRGGRGRVFEALHAEGIGVNVHYLPVHLHPYYLQNHGTSRGSCPNAEEEYERILSLPMFPRMSDQDAKDVVVAVEKVLRALRT